LSYVAGCYSLLRASSEDNYARWIDIRNFTLTQDDAAGLLLGDIDLWHDTTVKAGVSYIYAL
jgi:hypothetical protein